MENTRIQGDINYWNDLYAQDTREAPSSTVWSTPASNPLAISAAPSFIVSAISVSISTPMVVTEAIPSGSDMNIPMSVPFSSLVLSSPSLGFGNLGNMGTVGTFDTFGSVALSFALGSWDDVDATHQSRERECKECFGSIFPGSRGTGGNGDGGNLTHGQPQTSRCSTTFNIDIKPEEPPIFYGRASEDIDSWLAKVGDFIYLTEAKDRQQVAYMATLLQEATADWWTALLKERDGVRRTNCLEMVVLLQKRFWEYYTSCSEDYQARTK